MIPIRVIREYKFVSFFQRIQNTGDSSQNAPTIIQPVIGHLLPGVHDCRLLFADSPLTTHHSRIRVIRTLNSCDRL